jgi:hypothetical protein
MGSAMVNAVLVDESDGFRGGRDRSAVRTKQADLWFEKEKGCRKIQDDGWSVASLVAQKC